jgi:GGDEF domain-containing protein
LTRSSLRLREKLTERATRDNLTGLYNRRYMQEWLEQELHRGITARSA